MFSQVESQSDLRRLQNINKDFWGTIIDSRYSVCPSKDSLSFVFSYGDLEEIKLLEETLSFSVQGKWWDLMTSGPSLFI